MALISCPECGRQISDRAKMCIGCGVSIEEIKTLLSESETESQLQSETNNQTFDNEINGDGSSSKYINFDMHNARCVVCGSKYDVIDYTCPICGYPLLSLSPNTNIQKIDTYILS